MSQSYNPRPSGSMAAPLRDLSYPLPVFDAASILEVKPRPGPETWSGLPHVGCDVGNEGKRRARSEPQPSRSRVTMGR